MSTPKCPARYPTLKALQESKAFQQLQDKTKNHFNTLPAQDVQVGATPEEQFKTFTLPGSPNALVIYQHQKHMKTYVYWMPKERMQNLTSGPNGYIHLLTQTPQWKMEDNALAKISTKGIKWLVEKLSQAAETEEYLGVGEINIQSNLQPLFFKEWAKAIQFSLSSDFFKTLSEPSLHIYEGVAKGLWIDLAHIQSIAEEEKWTSLSPARFGDDQIFIDQGQLRWKFNEIFEMLVELKHPEEAKIAIAMQKDIHSRWTAAQIQDHEVGHIQKGQWKSIDPQKIQTLVSSVNYLMTGMAAAGYGRPEYPIDIGSYAYQMAFTMKKTQRSEAEILMDIFFNPTSDLYFKYNPRSQRMESMVSYQTDVLPLMSNPSLKAPLEGKISLPKNQSNPIEHPIHSDWLKAAHRLHHHLKTMVQEKTPEPIKAYVADFEQQILSSTLSQDAPTPLAKKKTKNKTAETPTKSKTTPKNKLPKS